MILSKMLLTYRKYRYYHSNTHGSHFRLQYIRFLGHTKTSLLLASRWFLAWLNLRAWRWRRQCSSETSVNFQRPTRCYIPKYLTLCVIYSSPFNICTFFCVWQFYQVSPQQKYSLLWSVKYTYKKQNVVIVTWKGMTRGNVIGGNP
jgi:hypothetical protein